MVLLVEDERFVREATCHTLERVGFEVLPAADALEAMTVFGLRDGQIDLLMTDMTLPGRSGRQLSQDLRRTSAGIPILLTSGYTAEQCAQEPRDLGIYFLAKPYTRVELVAAIEKIFSVESQHRRPAQAC